MHICLTSFLQKNNITNKSQHGFRSSHSTSTAVIDLIDSITSALDHKLMALALFIDMSKAFDLLDQAILISRLERYGVRGVPLSRFSSYLASRFHFIEINNNRSLCKVIKTGIPQRSILGPPLNTIYVNDIYVDSGLLTILINCIATTNTKMQKYCNNQYQYLIKKVLPPISITNTITLCCVVILFFIR